MAEHKSARMSKITNAGLTLSGTRCFSCTPIVPYYGNNGRQRIFCHRGSTKYTR